MKIRHLLILFILLAFPLTALSQTAKYNTTHLAIKFLEDNGEWSDWSDWEETKILVVVSLDREKISIYSEELQEYDIYAYEGEKSDSNGGITRTYNCVDTEGIRCQIRLRLQSDGSKQLYVDYSNVMWVYAMEDRN